jgi:hypothetical protein
LPDFYIQAIDCLVEIKPGKAASSDVAKWKVIARSGRSLIVFNANFTKPFAWIMHRKGGAVLDHKDSSAEHVMELIAAWLHSDLSKVYDASDAARSARFEHGESGAT